MIYILPRTRGLNGPRMLREAGATILNRDSRPRRDRMVTAWGSHEVPSWASRVNWLNHPTVTPLVSNKMNWAQVVQSANISPYNLDFTMNIDQAREWASEQGTKVVCRTLTKSSKGKGIVIARNADQVVKAPLYSRYFRKTSEYRIMYAPYAGAAFCYSKRRPNGVEMDRDSLLIRSRDSGYISQAEEFIRLPYAIEWAVDNTAIYLQDHYGLRYAAYDVAYNKHTDTACIIEANTAPALNDVTAAQTLIMLEQLENYHVKEA